MMMKTLAALAFTTGVTLSGSVLADPAKFDGTWSVSLVANGGLCGSGASSTLTVQNGSVRAGGSGVSVSGQVGPSGSVSLALEKGGVQDVLVARVLVPVDGSAAHRHGSGQLT